MSMKIALKPLDQMRPGELAAEQAIYRATLVPSFLKNLKPPIADRAWKVIDRIHIASLEQDQPTFPFPFEELEKSGESHATIVATIKKLQGKFCDVFFYTKMSKRIKGLTARANEKGWAWQEVEFNDPYDVPQDGTAPQIRILPQFLILHRKLHQLARQRKLHLRKTINFGDLVTINSTNATLQYRNIQPIPVPLASDAIRLLILLIERNELVRYHEIAEELDLPGYREGIADKAIARDINFVRRDLGNILKQAGLKHPTVIIKAVRNVGYQIVMPQQRKTH